MSVLEDADSLLKAIKAFDVAKEGDSGDEELDAAIEMRDAAKAFLLAVSARNVELAEMIDSHAEPTRESRLCPILGDSAGGYVVVNDNYISLSDPLEKYVAVELDGTGDPLWAYFGNTLNEITNQLDSSDTEGVEKVKVYDLDTGLYQVPLSGITDYGVPTKD